MTAMRFVILLLFVFHPLLFFSQNKTTTAVRTGQPPKIDGIEEDVWRNAVPISDFIQYDPWNGIAASQKTEVRILYDDKAIYIFANMYDTSPDSILMQLGNRDESPNADYFSVKFDTYNNQQDAYVFTVYSSGVQADYRYNDFNFNAVWESETVVNDKGWTAEIRIPYSAIRFPAKDKQEWRFQAERNIRRTRETDNWSPEIKEAENSLVYWGYIAGLENIEPPLRLSSTPYLSAGIEHFPYDVPGMSNISGFYGGGLDLKYGINESYTLDMTLLPDFSQVQSDDKVKNLSAFETVYSEQRPFFKEAVDLFAKGGLFYSRRIGRTPRGFYNTEYLADSGEIVRTNPNAAKLVNAFKISGRGKNGLAVGLFNAFTADTWAVFENTNGDRRRVLTEPAADYTVVVIDQALKNNSSVYYTNSSFLRNFPNYSSNVSAAGLTLGEKSNTYRLSLSGGYSTFYFTKNNDISEQPYKNGAKTDISLSKINGKVQFGVAQSVVDKSYNANDVGLTLYNNYINHSAWVSYIQSEPLGYFKNFELSADFQNSFNCSPFDNTGNSVNLNGHGTLLNYLWLWSGFSVPLTMGKDYYEPRVSGRFYITDPYYGGYLGFSSDYRKPFALDGNISMFYAAGSKRSLSYNLSPLIRINNHFIFRHNVSYQISRNDIGFAGFGPSSEIIFGVRDIDTWSQTFSGTYVFVNDLSLTLRARHYWSNGGYYAYPTLMEDGTLSETSYSGIDADFNYTSFNIDLVFSWQFSPGSIMNIVWKYELLHEGDAMPDNYFNHMGEAFEPPARNVVSLKFLYYLDYLMLKKK